MVCVRNLGKRYGSKWLFRHLEFELQVGDCLIVNGRNGSGKSTLLKCLAGLVSPSEGTYENGLTNPRLELGYSALDQSTYPQLSARDHLSLTADLRGCADQTEALLDFVGLEDRDLPSSQLSSGQRSRLRLAIAVQASPKLLLLDEPGAAMDEVGRELVAKIIAEHLTQGALVIASNDPSERRFANFGIEL